MITHTDIQIRFADIDMLRHVNNVNLQHYFDLGKSDFFRKALGLNVVWGEFGLITAATNTSYFEQTRFDASVYVETSLVKIGTKSITILQRLINSKNGALNAESTTVLVAYDFERQESITIPDSWRAAMSTAL